MGIFSSHWLVKLRIGWDAGVTVNEICSLFHQIILSLVVVLIYGFSVDAAEGSSSLCILKDLLKLDFILILVGLKLLYRDMDYFVVVFVFDYWLFYWLLLLFYFFCFLLTLKIGLIMLIILCYLFV